MKHSLLLLAITALGGCNVIPPKAYYNRGDPENLITASSDVANVSLASADALSKLTSLADNDPPSSVQLNCRQNDALCLEAKGIFDKRKVPVSWGSEQGSDEVTLLYQRVVARDCENRFIDNSINPYNLNHPTFGCSVAGNTVQMVTDKRQFTNPSLLDFTDAEKGVMTYREYVNPPADSASQQSGLGQSNIQSGTSN